MVHVGAAWWSGTVMLVLLVGVLVFSAATGQFATTPAQVVASLGRAISGTRDEASALLDATLWNVRFPRLLLGILVGAALAAGGAVMQGVFGNPLAEPGVIGVSSGAAVGACLVIVFGWGVTNPFTLPLAAFAGGLLVTWLVYLLARSGNRSMVLTLVLTGIAVNAVAGAVISFLVFLADTASREQIIFWQMGSLNGATWTAVATTAVVLGIGLVGALLLVRKLDLLSLGERPARHAGVDVERLRIVAILCVALLTSAAVAFAGIIGFVGLIVPHAVRLLTGPSHRTLVPLSALGGALLLSVADLTARTAIPFADLPIGIFTALVGGPVFFVLLRHTLKRQGVL
ncbi:FecCD family ABC transporter permease [Arthrobacter rhombi]|uniref:FecCD family ABC transporter permease n=1 Tax=Arthrobacter rhombi TaxID=71253 RepID=UPI003FD0C5FE